MIADLLTKLEDEKDQWIYEAIDHFNGLHSDGEKFVPPVGTAENQIMQLKNIEYSIRMQKSLDLERMEIEMKTIKAGREEAQRTHENLVSTLELLNKELEIYESELKNLDKIQLDEFQCLLDAKFTFDKKDQVVFKERKISKLMESYQMVEMDMLEYYQKQLSNIWVLLSRSMQTIDPTAKIDFKTEPPLVAVSLMHGRGLDQYLKPGNFEEDYGIVLDTLGRNNDLVYEYYASQVDQFKQGSKQDLMQQWTLKDEQKRLATENLLELQEMKVGRENRMVELQSELVRAKQEWEQVELRPQLLDDILKEEFVKAVSGWQEKLFAEGTSDEERWIYHQYCQIILKQAERIIGDEYF